MLEKLRAQHKSRLLAPIPAPPEVEGWGHGKTTTNGDVWPCVTPKIHWPSFKVRPFGHPQYIRDRGIMECSTIVPQISLPWDSKLTTADHTRQKGLRDRFSNPKGGGMFCKIVNPVNPVDSVKIAGLQLCVQFAWSPGPDSPSLWEPALSLGQPSSVTPEPGRRCYEPAKHLRVQSGVTCCPPPPPLVPG